MLPPRSNDSVGINFVRRAVVHQMNSDLDGFIWSRFELAQAVISSMQSKTSVFTSADAFGWRRHSSDASDLSCLWYSHFSGLQDKEAVVLERSLAVPHIKLIEVWWRYWQTNCVRSVKYEENQRCTEDDTPCEVNMRWSSTWWSTVLKAALKSRNATSASAHRQLHWWDRREPSWAQFLWNVTFCMPTGISGEDC